MPLSTAQKLQAWGVATPLALELARQLAANTGDARRLKELGFVPELGDYVAASITAGTFDGKLACELTMDSVLALKIKPLIAGPRNTVPPAITGTAQVGQTLTAANGTWLGSPTYARQWYAGGVVIPAATGTTYVPVVGDVGKTITVAVTGTNANGTGTVTSAPTAAVIAA